jgi:hypothetical protein
MIHKKKLHLLILAAILLIGFVFRLYRLDSPIADWHSWRQADTSAVSRNFVEQGYDLLHPRFDDLSNIPSGKENPEGYRFVEFPIYNVAQAGLFQIFGVFTLEEWGRLVSIFSSVLAALFLYLIVSRHSNKQLGLWTAFFYSFIPYNIYYGRTILPDTSMVMASLGGIYFFDLWVEKISNIKNEKAKIQIKNKKYLYFIFALLFTASAFLLKPYALFFTLPMVVLAYKRWGWKLLLRWDVWLFGIVAVLPLIWWRHWMTQYPEGIPANKWLLNGNGIRFRPSFFRWIGYERLTKLISGYLGVILLALSFVQLKKMKEWAFLLSFLVSSILYVCVFATGNVQHDYYQILIMPSLSIFFALGSNFLFNVRVLLISGLRLRAKLKKDTDSTGMIKIFSLGKIVLAICLVGMFYLSWNQVKDYFNINNRSIVIAGEAVDRLTPKDAKVIANYTGDTSFLYQTKRKGWPSFQYDMPKMVEIGADYLVLVNPTEQDMVFAKDYKVVAHAPEYVIFNLHIKP